MEFISRHFPFTLDEVRHAFVARGMSPEAADEAARTLAESFAEYYDSDEEPGLRVAELESWLDAVAEVSPDAAARVARYREIMRRSRPDQ